MSLPRFTVLSALLMLVLVSDLSQAVEFRDLWQTPEQRAARQLQNDQVEALIEDAPDARWRGIGHYRSEDYEAAADAFATDASASEGTDVETPAPSERHLDDLYNQATALTRSGDYDKAISLLDQVIEQQPDALDAQQNRSIAKRLKALIEEQQEPEQGGEGESGEQGEGGDSSDSDERGEAQDSVEQSSDSEDADSSDPAEDSESSSDTRSSSSESGSGERTDERQGDQQESPSESGDADTTQTDDEAMQEAADALAAAAEREGELHRNSENEQALSVGGDESEAPMSEDDQATEQWLRQIPDDPAGLLRRKLEQSHRNEFPEVRDAKRAW